MKFYKNLFGKDLKLKYLIISTGRSGTFSMTQHVNNLIQENNHDYRVQHETKIKELYELINTYLLNKNDNNLKNFIINLNHEFEVGNGYAFCMDILIKYFSKKLKVIYLRRNENEIIESILRRKDVGGGAWGNYIYEMNTIINMYRPNMTHYKLMQEKHWLDLTDKQRFLLYIRLTDFLVFSKLSKFKSFKIFDLDTLKHPSISHELNTYLGFNSNISFPWHGKTAGLNYETLSTSKKKEFDQINIFQNYNK